MIVIYQRPQFFDIHVFCCGIRLQIVTIEVDIVTVLAILVQNEIWNSPKADRSEFALITVRLRDLAYFFDSELIVVYLTSCWIYVMQRTI